MIYVLKDKETNTEIARISKPETASSKMQFEFFKPGDKVKLDPQEIRGSDLLEGNVDLDQVFTVVSAIPKELTANNKSKWQLLFLDSKVLEYEDDTGWSNSWFTKA